MKTLLETLNMNIEESAEELMGYAEGGATLGDMEDMIYDHIELSPSDIDIINESMMDADYPEGIIYDDIDDIANLEDLEADYDEYDRYYIVEGNVVKGYQWHELNAMIKNGEYYEAKIYFTMKLMEEETAKQIVNLCNEMMEAENEK